MGLIVAEAGRVCNSPEPSSRAPMYPVMIGAAKGSMADDITLGAAAAESASEIAEIHLAARREAMPHLHRPRTDEEIKMAVSSASGEGTALLVIDLQLGMFNGERLAPLYTSELLLVRVQT